eukprot:GFUD01054087.1.p1 GENE.GFUD01054087.1~~GFUD01054087.1.p1  ORF type:complete len:101 (-),score=16.10 GFUD01054087.1:95-397(-)
MLKGMDREGLREMKFKSIPSSETSERFFLDSPSVVEFSSNTTFFFVFLFFDILLADDSSTTDFSVSLVILLAINSNSIVDLFLSDFNPKTETSSKLYIQE